MGWNDLTERHLRRITVGLRRRRVETFVYLLDLGPDDRILDLGSEDGSYLGSFYPWPNRITLADIHEGPMRRGAERFGFEGWMLLSGDGTVPVKDRAFDAVWCNSVIEHVTVPRSELPGMSDREFLDRSEATQARFAREIARIASGYFVQTPYRHFPVETHSWCPGVQYLSQSSRYRLSQRMKKLWVKQWTADFRLYDRRRFKRHFPDATTCYTERFLGLPKSLVAVRQR